MVLSAIGEIKCSGWVGENEAVPGYGPDPSRRRGRGKEEKVVRTPRSCLPQRKTKKKYYMFGMDCRSTWKDLFLATSTPVYRRHRFMYFALDSISIQWRWKSMGEVRRYIRLDATAAIHLVDHKHCNDHEYKFRLLDLGVSFR